MNVRVLCVYVNLSELRRAAMQANLRYSEVVLRIKPLTAELDKLQESLAAGVARIEQCTEELATLDARKHDLQAELTSRTEEAAELKVLSSSISCVRAYKD